VAVPVVRAAPAVCAVVRRVCLPAKLLPYLGLGLMLMFQGPAPVVLASSFERQNTSGSPWVGVLGNMGMQGDWENA